MTTSAPSFPAVVTHAKLYSVGRPRKRTDRDGWWVSYTDPLTKKRRQAKFSLERDAWAFVDRVEADRDGLRCGRITAKDVAVGTRSRTDIDDVLTEYRDYLKRRKRSEKHQRETHRLLTRICNECRVYSPSQIVADRVDLWLDSFDSSETANTYLCRVRAFCTWMVRAGYLAASPVADIERRKATDPTHKARALTFDELDALLTCEKVEPYRRLWYALSARGGLRHNEIERLAWRDVDFADGWLRIPGSKTKMNTAAELPLPQSLLRELREARGADDERVVPMRPRRRVWLADIKRAGIKGETHAGHAYLKSLRKTYITHLLIKTNGNLSVVKNLARHARITTTDAHYTDHRLLDMEGAVDMLDSEPGETKQQKRA